MSPPSNESQQANYGKSPLQHLDVLIQGQLELEKVIADCLATGAKSMCRLTVKTDGSKIVWGEVTKHKELPVKMDETEDSAVTNYQD